MAVAADDGWTLWGPVHDREATLGVIRALEADGNQVKVVRIGNRNDVYITPRRQGSAT